MEWFEAARDLLLGGTCASCGAPGAGICRPCGGLLDHLTPLRASRDLSGFPPTWSAGEYDGPLRGVLNAYKERGSWGFAPRLGGLLARAVAGTVLDAGGGSALVLVPMPSSARAVRARGLDVTRRLAQAAAARLRGHGLRVSVLSALRQRSGVKDQSELSAEQRWANLAGGLALRRLPRHPVVLVDDVVTTGATLSAAAALLAASRVRVLGGATVAATALRSQGATCRRRGVTPEGRPALGGATGRG